MSETPSGDLGTNDQPLAAFIAVSRSLSRLFPLRGAGREISKKQLLIARSLPIRVDSSAKLCMPRRDLLAAMLGPAAVAIAGCDGKGDSGWLDQWWSGPLPPAGELLSPNFRVGHQIPPASAKEALGKATEATSTPISRRARDDRGAAAGGEAVAVRAHSAEILDCVIVGGGVAGLSAARRLIRRGIQRFQVLELEAAPGGTARSGQRDGFQFPWGAHYLPVPMPENRPLIEFLGECGILERSEDSQIVQVGEQHLCRDPEERVFAGGQWTRGVWPVTVASSQDRKQRDRFQKQMAELGQRRGSDGRRWFAIPTSLTTQDPAALKQLRTWDSQTMASWMSQNGYDSPVLQWLVDHACRDDYGLSIDQTSGWAGLFYFASRIADASGRAQPVMTWPSGNGRLVETLAATVGERLRCNQAVMAMRMAAATGRTDDCVELDVLNTQTNQRKKLVARRVIVAIPHFIARHLVPATHLPVSGFGENTTERQDLPTMRYGAWWVANVRLADRPQESNGQMCWDNIAYQSKSLGYVNATHQLGADHGPTVLTWYHAVVEEVPEEARRQLLQMTWADAAEVVLSDLERMHPDIRRLVERLDVMRWGHAMIQPRVGVFSDPNRIGLMQPQPPVHFANTDLSGVALFEEAFDHGFRAAEEVANALRN